MEALAFEGSLPPFAIAGRGEVGSDLLSSSRDNLVFGTASGDVVRGLGQSWYAVGNPGSKAGIDAAILSNDRAVPYFHSQNGTWWSGSDTVTDVQKYPEEVAGVITGDNYTVKLDGEILIEKSGVVRFLDGVDDFTYLAIDIDRSGTAGDSDGEVLINDNNWTNALSQASANGGAPIVEAEFQDIATGGEWLAIEFNMAEGGGGDSGMLYWDALDEDGFFPLDRGEGIFDEDAAKYLIPDTHLRGLTIPAPLLSGDVVGSVPSRESGWEIDVNPADGTSDAFGLTNPDSNVFKTILNVDGIEFHINPLGAVSEGATFQIFLADVILGTPTIATEGWSFNAATKSITFGSVAPGLPGDIDGDGTVAFADFLVLSANFGNSVAAGTMGDIDGDGNVGFSDFLVLSNNFGKSALGAQSVPEPTGLVLFGFASLVAGALRRRRA